ncbi:hypothetical protein AGMMS50256_08190 [Betaproteobacteria bacterium]|nr:hypothetical protein AGMMS50256_08190 [Betaproteobacteria bacterium]
MLGYRIALDARRLLFSIFLVIVIPLIYIGILLFLCVYPAVLIMLFLTPFLPADFHMNGSSRWVSFVPVWFLVCTPLVLLTRKYFMRFMRWFIRKSDLGLMKRSLWELLFRPSDLE